MAALTPREIGRAADRLFQALIPPHWAITNQQDQEDCGIDYEIELRSRDQPMGHAFKIQLKGQFAAKYTESGSMLAYSGLPIDKLHYYLNQMDVPVIFVVADLATKAVYWAKLQGDTKVADSLADALEKKQSSMTIYLPCANVLPTTLDQLLNAASESLFHLSLREVLRPSASEFAAAVRLVESAGTLASQLEERVGILRLAELEELIERDEWRLAETRARRTANNVDYSADIRFTAFLYEEKCTSYLLRELAPAELETAYAALQVRTLHNLQTLPLRGYDHLRFYRMAHKRTIKLTSLVRRYAQQSMLVSTAADIETPSRVEKLYAERAHVGLYAQSARVIAEYNRCVRVIWRTIKLRHFGVIPQVVARILGPMHLFLISLRVGSGIDEANRCQKILDEFAKFAIDLAVAQERWQDVLLVALTSLTLDTTTTHLQIRQQILRIKDASWRAIGLKELEEAQQEMGSLQQPDRFSEKGIALRKQMFSNLAAAMGIDVADQASTAARIVATGLADLDPTRVLRHCESTFAIHSGTNQIARLLQMPSAGSKTLVCSTFHYAVEADSLDEALLKLKARHCEACPRRVPRNLTWQFSEKFAEEDFRKNAAIIQALDIARGLQPWRPAH